PTVVTPAGIVGLTFRNEAETANALIPKLKAEGVDAIVVLIHQGAESAAGFGGDGCDTLSGDLLPILEALDPEVDLVVSGHTHRAYVCDYARLNPAKPFLVTSAGDYGTMLTDIRLTVDPARGDVVAKSAKNLIVQGEGYASSGGEIATTDAYPLYVADAEVAALVDRYVKAAEPLAARVVGRLAGPAPRSRNEAGESPLGALVADAQLAATNTPATGGAEIALMNPGGVRADLIPAADGSVTYGQLFAVQPFGNALVVKSFTGRQLKAILEQQFDSGSNSISQPNILQASRGFSFGYDLSKPAGQRIVAATLNGRPLEDDRVYRVTTNGFLASGGDNFTLLRDGTDQVGGPQDLDALEAYVAANSPLTPPEANRIRNMSPR
ncbi:MAG: bifunctional metallophosphatase/5'-nucleotidase, partial [Allosphingosinicella sp.]